MGKLKEMFQTLRREHVKKLKEMSLGNTASAPASQNKPITRPSEPLKQEPRRVAQPSPEAVSLRTGTGGRLSPGTFELSPTTEPRQTYEQSRAKLDPRQALFESIENSNNNLIEDFAELESEEEDLEQTPSDSRNEIDLKKAQRSLYDSNYQTYKQLQKELNQVKEMYTELEAEHKELKDVNKRLVNERDELVGGQRFKESLPERQTDSPRFNAQNKERSVNPTDQANTRALEDELKQIMALVKENLKVQTESLERQRASETEQRLIAASQVPTEPRSSVMQQWPSQTNPYRLPSIDELKCSSDKQSSEIKIDIGLIKEQKKTKKRQDSNLFKPPSSDKLATSKESKNRMLESSKNHRKRSKATVTSGSEGFTENLSHPKLSSLGFVIYRKWKDILGLEWHVVQQSAARLEKERMILRHRKAAVQKYEWDMLWSVKDVPSEEASKKVLHDIKHVIYDYELDAEKVALLTSLLESRLKKLKMIEQALDLGFKASKIDQYADEHLTQLFNNYIAVANLYEKKLRMNTSQMNPFKNSRLGSTAYSSQQRPGPQIESIHLNSPNRSVMADARSKVSRPQTPADPHMSHLEFLKFTMSKIRQGEPIEGSVFNEINTFFESQYTWFDTISEEIKAIIRRLDNPSNISALRSK